MDTLTLPHLFDVVNENLLLEHLNEGRVSVQFHPKLPLRIYNYTHAVRDPKVWGDGTIDWCRGLIVDDKNQIIARPFKKFHNLNTAAIPETLEENLPNEEPVITDKLDGSLGILYQYDGHVSIATRGSFTSPQAKWATEWFANHSRCWKQFWPEDYTALFEIIYAENRIVLDYCFEGLVALGMVHIATGREISRDDLVSYAYRNGVQYTQRCKTKPVDFLKSQNEKNREGYVLTYSNGLKIKIKFEDYVRIHRVVTGTSPKAIWEMLSKGEDLTFLDNRNLTEHFLKWVFSWRDKLVGEFTMIYEPAKSAYFDRPATPELASDKKTARKMCAEYFLQQPAHLHSVLFAMLDGHDPTPIIWRQIKPRGDDKSFLQDGE